MRAGHDNRREPKPAGGGHHPFNRCGRAPNEMLQFKLVWSNDVRNRDKAFGK